MIQSNSDVISNHATQIANAESNILNIGAVSNDSNTTLRGNTKAHSAINRNDAAGSKVTYVLEKFSSQIQRTAQEFEAVDEQISQQLFTAASAQ